MVNSNIGGPFFWNIVSYVENAYNCLLLGGHFSINQLHIFLKYDIVSWPFCNIAQLEWLLNLGLSCIKGEAF